MIIAATVLLAQRSASMRRRVFAIVPVFLVFLSLVVSSFSGELPSAKPQEVGVSSQALDRLDAYIQKMVDNKQLPGVVVMMARHGSYFHVPKEKCCRLATVYLSDDKGQLQRRLEGKVYDGMVPYSVDSACNGNTCYLSGGGGLCSTASDYLRFCQMLLNGGQLDGKRILREETVRAMRTNQIGELNIAPGQKFGLGFRVVEKIDQRDLQQLVGSYSWGGFFGTLFWIVPKEDWILVVMLQEVGGPKPPSGWPGELERLAAAAVVK
jgi:CubicO group peptidase (beta-lactamase class C family)